MTGAHGVQSKDHAHRFRSACPYQPRDSQDFSPSDRQVNHYGSLSSGEAPCLQEHFARCPVFRRVQISHASADHHLHHIFHRGIGGPAGPNRATVPKDSESVCEGLHLFQEMGYVDDGYAVVAQSADDVEQPAHVIAGKAAGWLVEHDHTRVGRQGSRDLDQLPGGDGQSGDTRVERNLRMAQALEGDPGATGRSRPVDEDPADRLHTQDDVILDREVWRQGEFLIDHGDAVAAGRKRTGRTERPTVEFQLASVGSYGARQHLHQCALPCPVLTHQRVDLARRYGQTYV